MTEPRDEIERKALALRDAGYLTHEVASATGMTASDVRALWLRDDGIDESH